MSRALLTLLGLLAVCPPVLLARERVLVLGDSITHEGHWVTRVEAVLRGSDRFADAEVVNLGLPSETVSGLSEAGHAGGAFPRPCLHERLERVLTKFKPTLVLACYGINDGIYQPVNRERAAAFQTGMVKLRAAVEKHQAEIVLITAPLYKADNPAADPYDAVLDAQAKWLKAQQGKGWKVIDIRPELRRQIVAAKAADPSFVYAVDGIHPGERGHGMIAGAVCGPLLEILKIPDQPNLVTEELLKVLRERGDLLKLAWLSETGHSRPGIPAGLPLDQASAKADELMAKYREIRERKLSDWNGYKMINFTVAGRPALVVRPKMSAAGNPWIWRTEFFGHEPQADVGLLEKGFHVAYIDMQNLYGGPLSMTLMDGFYEHLVFLCRLSPKVVLEGFSRGGLFAFNWAARRPDCVAGMYVDAPVCDFKSWPGGKGKGPGSPNDWQNLLKVYELTEEEAMAYPHNPVDRLKPLADAKIPILAVIGDADEAVPVEENTGLVEKRYRALGGEIKVISKPGGKHHPHSLRNPEPIVEFAVKASGGRDGPPGRPGE